MAKLIVLTNFTCDDRHEPAEDAKGNKEPPHREWVKGEEYTGDDDVERLQAEGLIGPEEEAPKAAKPKGKKPAKGKKTATDLAEGEGIKTNGEAAGETVPASGKEPDGEEELDGDDDDAPPAPKAKKPAAKAKGAGKKK